MWAWGVSFQSIWTYPDDSFPKFSKRDERLDILSFFGLCLELFNLLSECCWRKNVRWVIYLYLGLEREREREREDS